MSTRQRWNTMSPSARNRVAVSLSAQTNRWPRYTARMMERRQAALHAYIWPAAWPGEIARMRESIGTAVDRRSALRIWALKHQLNLLAALKALPGPTLP